MNSTGDSDSSLANHTEAPPSPPLLNTFGSTRWSIVRGVVDGASSVRSNALASLYQTYWKPLWAYAKAQGLSPADCDDIIQSFFVTLLKPGSIASADPSKGKFRSYLLGALKHFLAKEWRRQRTQKAGSEYRIINLDDTQDERLSAIEPGHETPREVFDREWAIALIEQARKQMRWEHASRGKLALLSALEPSLLGGERQQSDDSLASEFGIKAVSVRSELSRMRKRFAQILRELVAETVTDPTEVEEELRYLVTAFSKSEQ